MQVHIYWKRAQESHEKWFNNHRSNDLHRLVCLLWRYFYPSFLSPALNSAVNIIHFWEPDRMECEPGTASSGPTDPENVGPQGATSSEGGRHGLRNSWPPHELVECQLVGCRETKDPGLTSFVKMFIEVCSSSCLGWEIAVTGGERSDTLSKRSLYLPA